MNILMTVFFDIFQNLDKFSQLISIIGMHPFMGIVDFINSKDLIVILTSASEGYYFIIP